MLAVIIGVVFVVIAIVGLLLFIKHKNKLTAQVSEEEKQAKLDR